MNHAITNEISTEEAISLEFEYGAHNYHPLPVVLSRGEGVFLYDVEGARYYDFLSAYSAVNQGHCHPRIIKSLIKQASRLTLTSRAFHSDQLGLCERYLCEYFGYEKSIMSNSGAEAVETAIKIARKWGYEVKGIRADKAKIVVVERNFHGRTTTIISASTDPLATRNFGPFTPGFVIIPYDDIPALEKALQDTDVCGFLVEPIQGEAGVYVPQEGYLEKAKKLCETYNVLFMIDEIQTGVGRTGKMLACDHENVKADLLMLGKAVSGGVYPVSVVLADNQIMDVLKPGEHGSTYGGNPLACAVTMEALQVIKDEKLVRNAEKMGMLFRENMNKIASRTPLIKEVRGKGLLNSVVIDDTESSQRAWNICLELKENGLLAKPTHGNIIRFAPPLVINEHQMDECCDIIERTICQ